MEEKELMLEHVKKMEKFIDRVDMLNKRLIWAIVAIVFFMCALMGVVAVVYFTASYDYGTVIQTQSQNENSQEQQQKVE